jgi:hypothetical protein
MGQAVHTQCPDDDGFIVEDCNVVTRLLPGFANGRFLIGFAHFYAALRKAGVVVTWRFNEQYFDTSSFRGLSKYNAACGPAVLQRLHGMP